MPAHHLQAPKAPDPIMTGSRSASTSEILLVDIGRMTTEITVLAAPGPVVRTSLRIAGKEMDEAIASHVRRQHSLLIGELTAERIKLTIGSAVPLPQELSMEVKGRDTLTGLVRRSTVTSIEIREALGRPVQVIGQAIWSTFWDIPVELWNPLVRTGAVLRGGGSLLFGVSEALSAQLGIPVRREEAPS